MCTATLPGGKLVSLAYDPAGGANYRGEFLLSLGDRSVSVAVPTTRYLTQGAFNQTPDRLSNTETTAYRLEDDIAGDLREQFGVSQSHARVAARGLVRQMIDAHPGTVSFSTEIPRWAQDVPGA